MANTVQALLAAKATAKKLRASSTGSGLGAKVKRDTVGAGAETHLERTSRNGAVRQVRRESAPDVEADEVRPGGSGEAEDGWKPSASFTAGVRAALSNFLPNGSNQSWQTSKRSSSGRPQGYDDSPATAQLIDAVLEDSAEDVEAAIEAGAHINGRVEGRTQADAGQTAVIKAVRLGCLEVLDQLMQKGADPYIKDDLHRDAWYYACFGINMKDGDHQTVMSLMLMYWELEQDVLLLAMHSPHPGVRREALNALDLEVVSRDSKDNCIIRFNDLGLIDSKDSSVRFPDGSRSQPGLSPLTKMIRMEAMESVSHPAVMAVIWWKWKAFGRMCLLFDLLFYLAALVCTSAWAIRFKQTSLEYLADYGSREELQPIPAESQDSWLEGYKTASLVTALLMLWEETMLVSSVCIKTKDWTPIFGRFLHSLCALVPIFGAYALHAYGYYREVAQVLAVAVITMWLRVLYFAKFTRGFGSFCITLIEMIRRDLMKCMLILLLVLPGFLIAISLLVHSQCAADLEDDEVARWTEEGKSTMSLIFLLLGTTSWYDTHPCLDHPVANISAVLFLLVTMIVLLNLLIAMFSDTYERIQGMSVHTWALNLAEYIMQKEIWMGVIGYRSRWVLMAQSEHSETYEVRGRYQDYFLPALRIDNGDERVEDHILAQLQALAEISKLRHEEMSGRMKRIERSFMAEKIKTAAASALKGALGGGRGGGGGGAGGLLATMKANMHQDAGGTGSRGGGLSGIAEESTATAAAKASPSKSSPGGDAQMASAQMLQRVTAAPNPRASMDLMSRNQWAAYEADSSDTQRIQKQARPGRKSTAPGDRRRSYMAGTPDESGRGQGLYKKATSAFTHRTSSDGKRFTEQLQPSLHEPAAGSKRVLDLGAQPVEDSAAKASPSKSLAGGDAGPASSQMASTQMLQRVTAGANPRASVDLMSRNQWAAYEADSSDAQRIQKQARPGRKSTAPRDRRMSSAAGTPDESGRGQGLYKPAALKRTSSEAKHFTEQLQRSLHEPAAVSRRATAVSNMTLGEHTGEEDESERAPLIVPGQVESPHSADLDERIRDALHKTSNASVPERDSSVPRAVRFLSPTSSAQGSDPAIPVEQPTSHDGAGVGGMP